MFVQGDTNDSKSYELERVLDKRVSPRGSVKYLVRWKGYGPEEDVWKSVKELENAKELIEEYEARIAATKSLRPTTDSAPAAATASALAAATSAPPSSNTSAWSPKE